MKKRVNFKSFGDINISNWPSGLYIYQLQHEQIKLHSEKFEVLR